MKPVRLAIDVTGGDHGCAVVVRGVLEAQRLCPDAFTAVLCGDRASIATVFGECGFDSGAANSGLTIDHCTEIADSDAIPSKVWKQKTGASIVRCIRLQQEGVVDASISAGSTGVLMATAVFILGKPAGITRPALAAFIPTAGVRPVLLLDVGANLDCRPDHLLSFAVMGHEYVQRFYGLDSPRVTLLNVGVEPGKGTKLVFETNELLVKECPGYAGYIEGSRILSGDADVVVCDGFVGNALLKSFESFYGLTESVLADNAGLLAQIESNMAILNPEKYGAVPLIGVNGVIFKAHGNSSPRAISNAVVSAVTAFNQRAIHVSRPEEPKGRDHIYAV